MFEKNFPGLNWWINNQGWIQLGSEEERHNWIMVLDENELSYEDENSQSLEEAMKKAEKWVLKKIKEEFDVIL